MTNEKAIYFLDKRKKELLEKQDSKEGFEFIKALAEIRSLEMAIQALEQQPSEDCISREEVRKVLSNEVFELMKLHTTNPEENPKADAMAHGVNWSLNTLMELPSVHPKYTDEEIDKAQAVEQAYVDKMVELAVEESRKKWLESFDTSSATKCFEAVNLLKQRLEGEE